MKENQGATSIYEDNLRRINEAFERGHKMGLMEGATKNKNISPWNLPVIKPRDCEEIVAIVRPFNWGSKRLANKAGMKYVMLTGAFVDASMVLDEPILDVNGEELDFDAVVYGRKKSLPWAAVVAWLSINPPDWMYKEEEDG